MMCYYSDVMSLLLEKLFKGFMSIPRYCFTVMKQCIMHKARSLMILIKTLDTELIDIHFKFMSKYSLCSRVDFRV